MNIATVTGPTPPAPASPSCISRRRRYRRRRRSSSRRSVDDLIDADIDDRCAGFTMSPRRNFSLPTATARRQRGVNARPQACTSWWHTVTKSHPLTSENAAGFPTSRVPIMRPRTVQVRPVALISSTRRLPTGAPAPAVVVDDVADGRGVHALVSERMDGGRERRPAWCVWGPLQDDAETRRVVIRRQSALLVWVSALGHRASSKADLPGSVRHSRT